MATKTKTKTKLRRAKWPRRRRKVFGRNFRIMGLKV